MKSINQINYQAPEIFDAASYQEPASISDLEVAMCTLPASQNWRVHMVWERRPGKVDDPLPI